MRLSLLLTRSLLAAATTFGSEFSDSTTFLNTAYPKSSSNTLSSSYYLQKYSSTGSSSTSIVSTTIRPSITVHGKDKEEEDDDSDNTDDEDDFTSVARTAVAKPTNDDVFVEKPTRHSSSNSNMQESETLDRVSLPTANIQPGNNYISPSISYQPQRINLILGVTFGAIILVSMLIGATLAVRVIQRNRKARRREQVIWLFQSNNDNDDNSEDFGRESAENWFLRRQRFESAARRHSTTTIALQRLGPSSKFSKAVRLAAAQQSHSPTITSSSP